MYAVEARIFDNGLIVAKVRPAAAEDTNGCLECETCDIWIDLFESETEARKFAAQYKYA